MYSRIRSSRCPRCYLQINDREPFCPHCKNLSEADAKKLKPSFKKTSLKLNNELGKSFRTLSLVTIIFLILLAFI